MNRFMPEKELQGKFKCTKDLYGILSPHFSDFGMEKLVQPLPLESLKKKKILRGWKQAFRKSPGCII